MDEEIIEFLVKSLKENQNTNLKQFKEVFISFIK